jgi:coproporphyrinogen III oxidase-like Fe-S oxidoreductase
LGGGTPTFLGPDTLTRLIDGVSRTFGLSRAAGRDFSIEFDPRSVPNGRIAVTASGRLLLRSMAMCLDGYLNAPRGTSEATSFSKVV